MFLFLNNRNKNIILPFVFIIIILFRINNSHCYLILPFKRTNIPIINSKTFDNPIEDILSKISLNTIYTTISIGNPRTNIDFYFSMEEYISTVNINSCLKNSSSSYNPSNSNSLKNIQDINNSILSNEECSVYNNLDLTENITLNTFQFYLMKNNDKIENNNLIELNKYCGTIGLRRFSSNYAFDKESFIYQLKKNNIIDSYSWGIFFFNQEKLYNIDNDIQEQYDGFFITGITMNDNIDIFDVELVNNVYAEEGSLYWTMYFDRIFYYEKVNNSIEYISTNNTRVEFIIDLNYIICDEQYYKDIKKIYFQQFFDNNTCYEEKSYKKDGGYTYMIICDLSFKKNKRSFPGIYFYSEQLCFAFNLYHEDVFYEYNNKIYFLIVYKDSIKNFWRLGKIFLEKYPFMFDYDKKIISYVHLKKTWKPKNRTKKQKNKIKENSENKNNNNINIKDYILLILLIIGIFIGVFIGKRIWNKNKKLKANELEEKYKYLQPDKKEIGIIN